MREYIIKVVKKQYVRTTSDNKTAAKQQAEEIAMANPDDDELVGSKIIDIIEIANYERDYRPEYNPNREY